MNHCIYRIMRTYVLLILLFFTAFPNLRSQDIESDLQEILSERHLMGLSALAICNDSVVYTGSFGFADFASKTPMSDSTLFRVASISKTVTATALMILYDQGLFNLDEDIGNLLGYPVRNPHSPNMPISVRMLLSHTSGFKDGTGYSRFLSDTYNKAQPPKLQSLLSDTGSYYTDDIWQMHKPGSYFMYCNLNFGIAATLVEKLSGERFDKFCLKYIFEPLGMNSAYNIQDIDNVRNVAVLYRMSNNNWQPQADNFKGVMPSARDLTDYNIGDNGMIFGPQGSLRVSAKDLAVFMSMHMNGGVFKGVRVLKDSTVKLMHTSQWKYNGSNGDNYFGLFRAWGLGFQILTNSSGGDVFIEGFNMIGHIGESYGLISNMYFDKEKQVGFVLITNGCITPYKYGAGSSFYAVEEDVFNVLYNDVVGPCMNGSGVPINYTSSDIFSIIDTIPVRFYLPVPGSVTCDIYNIQGQLMGEQITEFDTYGLKQIKVDKKGLSAGIYFCILYAKGNRNTFSFSIEN